MNLNDINIFSLEDRKILRNFFTNNREFLETHSLLDINNLKLFGDMFEIFLNENNLEDNIIFKAFLLDIRCEELKQKLGRKTKTIQDVVLTFAKPITKPPFEVSTRILRWYEESKVVTILDNATIKEINRNIEPKIEQNRLERILSFESGAKVRVK